MGRVGDARVSTLDQDLDIQLAKLKAEGCGVIRSEKVSAGFGDGRHDEAVVDRVARGPADTLSTVSAGGPAMLLSHREAWRRGEQSVLNKRNGHGCLEPLHELGEGTPAALHPRCNL
ncbi:MAG: hypothetical protein ACRYGP_32110 [Janthinobacterium lividum]